MQRMAAKDVFFSSVRCLLHSYMGVSALYILLHLHIVIISVHACTVFSEFTPCNQPTCVLYHTMASKATRTEYEFVKTPSEEYFCPITFELLKDPRQTNSCCGHHLSREAAEQTRGRR